MSHDHFTDPGSWLGSATPFHAFRVRVILVREGSPGTYPTFTSSGAVYRMFRSLCDLDREIFLSLLLDAKQRLTGVGLVSVGTLDASLVHPREVFKPAVVGNAASVICLHNHPSGSPAAWREPQKAKTLRFAGANRRGARGRNGRGEGMGEGKECGNATPHGIVHSGHSN
jgi:RadC-like JAB domain-containing protein